MDADRVKWNQRYQEGSYGNRRHPTVLLEQWLSQLPHDTALDIACGTARNTRYMANSASHVVGVDISDVAIAQARVLSGDFDNIEFITADLDDGLQLDQSFDLIVVVRFVDLNLIQNLPEFLRPRGVILIEEHLQWDDPNIELAGPQSSRFRTAPGEVASALSSLETLYEYEGIIADPTGESAAVAQHIAQLR